MISKIAGQFLKIIGMTSNNGVEVTSKGEMKVDASGATVPVSGTVAVTATDLDIRDLDSAKDSVTVTGSVNAAVTGTVTATATDLDIRNLNATDDKVQLGALDSNISANSGKQLKVTIYRADGTEGLLDNASGALVGIDYAHHKIHIGDHFFIANYAALSTGNTIIFGVTTPNTTKWAHMSWDIHGTNETLFQVYEAATFTGGTPVTCQNNNRNSNTLSGLTVVTTPTITVAGNLIEAVLLGADLVSPSRADFVGAANRERELILKQNTQYVFIFTSNGYDINLSYLAYWYEHTNL
jgi:hypothetical protein